MPLTLDKVLNQYVSSIDSRLQSLLSVDKPVSKELYEAASYVVTGSAKRLRPVLVLMVVDMLGEKIQRAIDPACAIELVHSYSLVHDDLPCMDDDIVRRGKPTCHIAFSEATAVLVGDFLLTYAFEILSKAPDISSHEALTLIRLLAEKSGGQGMVGGQHLDISLDGIEVDLPLLNTIYARKTADLISLSLEFGAILGKANEVTLKRLLQFGQKIGLAFQITDDILDYKQDTSKKNYSSNSKEVNYISFLGLVRSKKQAESLIDSALEDLKMLAYNTRNLEIIALKLLERSV